MKTRVRFALFSAVLGAALLLPPAGVSGAADGAPKFESVTLRVGHRAFPDWFEDHRVTLREPFQVGDSDLSAEIIRYEPDFTMMTKTRRITSRSDQPNNPAFQIVVYEGDAPHDTTWAFLKMPPHFGAKSLVAFKVMRIDFKGRKPLVNTDTTAVQMPPMPAHGGGHP